MVRAWGAAERLAQERNVRMCTLRPDGSPHVTPVWFNYQRQTWWIGSDKLTVKVRNVKRDPRVPLALESGGDAPVVAAGRAQLRRDFSDDVVAAFSAKYNGWDVRLTYGSSGARILFKVPVDTWLLPDHSVAAYEPSMILLPTAGIATIGP